MARLLTAHRIGPPMLPQEAKRRPLLCRRDHALTILAFLTLAAVDIRMNLFGFPTLYRTVKKSPTAKNRTVQTDIVSRICTAVERAAFYYFRETKCLVRSATITMMLRRFGVAAELIIGCTKLPFLAHAWVEVNGKVIADSESVKTTYALVDRI